MKRKEKREREREDREHTASPSVWSWALCAIGRGRDCRAHSESMRGRALCVWCALCVHMCRVCGVRCVCICVVEGGVCVVCDVCGVCGRSACGAYVWCVWFSRGVCCGV